MAEKDLSSLLDASITSLWRERGMVMEHGFLSSVFFRQAALLIMFNVVEYDEIILNNIPKARKKL